MQTIYEGKVVVYRLESEKEKNIMCENVNKDRTISSDIDVNIESFKRVFLDCADIKSKELVIGKADAKIKCFVAYIEVALDVNNIEDSVAGRVLQNIEEGINPVDLNVVDVSEVYDMEEALNIILTGNILLFVDGYRYALRISSKGYPNMGVNETDSEKVIRGSNEGFSDSIKLNTALVRRRIRSTDLKVKETKAGLRSNTTVDVMYMKDIVYPHVVTEILARLDKYEIDGVLDSGVIEQLAEEKWYSPFPEFQTTKRPDRAAMAVLEGRVVVLCDNSPVALILPTDFNSFLKTTDDYYNRFEVASFARLIRYVSAFLAMTLPGLYLAVTNFHTQILPTSLLLSFWEARIGCPFPEVVEVVLMELSFELLREAGVRLPGAMGNTIGIVGGLIIGQAAVDANLISPIVVIVVAFTALCSFAIPSEEFAFAFRILKFLIIGLSAWLGYFGFLVGIYMVIIHLSKLKSFGIPYLSPFVAPGETEVEGENDSVIRKPLRLLKYRPLYARRSERLRLKAKE